MSELKKYKLISNEGPGGVLGTPKNNQDKISNIIERFRNNKEKHINAGSSHYVTVKKKVTNNLGDLEKDRLMNAKSFKDLVF
jgi:hypothetical protein